MKLLRCRICGETYLGTGAPDRCPFCGAGERYFVPAEQYPADVNSVDLTEVELADLQTAIGLERDNARFYAALGTQTGNPTLQSAYKRLSSIEAEHCSVFSKLAGVPKPADLRDPSSSTGDWCVDIADSLAREQRASASTPRPRAERPANACARSWRPSVRSRSTTSRSTGWRHASPAARRRLRGRPASPG